MVASPRKLDLEEPWHQWDSKQLCDLHHHNTFLSDNWNWQFRRRHYHWDNKFIKFLIKLFASEVLNEPCSFIDGISPFASPIPNISFCCLRCYLPRISWNECYQKFVPSTLRNLEKWTIILSHLEATDTSPPSKKSKNNPLDIKMKVAKRKVRNILCMYYISYHGGMKVYICQNKNRN